MQVYSLSNEQVTINVHAKPIKHNDEVVLGFQTETTLHLSDHDVTTTVSSVSVDEMARYVGIIVRNNSSAIQYHAESTKLVALINDSDLMDRAMKHRSEALLAQVAQFEADVAYV